MNFNKKTASFLFVIKKNNNIQRHVPRGIDLEKKNHIRHQRSIACWSDRAATRIKGAVQKRAQCPRRRDEPVGGPRRESLGAQSSQEVAAPRRASDAAGNYHQGQSLIHPKVFKKWLIICGRARDKCTQVAKERARRRTSRPMHASRRRRLLIYVSVC